MTGTIRITTETHHDIGVHIVYATERPTPHHWHTIELDRHTIGAYNHDHHQEAHDLTAATIKHYTHGNEDWHNHTTATAEPTPTTRAILALKTQEETTSAAHQRGQTIINQIRADRARRAQAIKERKHQLTQRPTSMLDLITNKQHSVFA